MDIQTLIAAIGIIKRMPDSSAAKAEAAAERAETARDLAEQYGYRITVDKSTLTIGQEGS